MTPQSNRSLTSIIIRPSQYLLLRLLITSILLSTLFASHAQETCHANDDETRTESAGPPREQPPLEESDEAPFWREYSIDDFFSHFECFSILPGYGDDEDDDDADETDAKSPKRSVDELELDAVQLSDMTRQLERLRLKYQNEIDTVPIPDKSQAKKSIRVPFAVGDAGEKGRGIYAREFVPKGTLVQDTSTDNVGVFKDADAWRRYVYTLGEVDAEAACNFMEWCWVQHIPELDGGADDVRRGWTVFIAFDESGLLNNAEWGADVANLRCGNPPPSGDGDEEEWGPCTYHYYATRDIEAGEELLVNYSEFEDESQIGWVEFGVGAIVH